ncbi:MAG: hypothetical protein E7625_00895 [Ruminococcaceae bacterium]|nr:hypothetical protein [Oscillospiraceae bacterium]
MKIFIRSMSTLLAVLMMLGSFAVLSVLNVSAADEEETVTVQKAADTINYVKEVFNNPNDALQWMTPYLENDNFVMYFNNYTGAFAVKNKKTGQIQFSNPYDVASSKGSEKTKSDVLSQIIVKYTDKSTGNSTDLYSYRDAALSDQIKVKRIKGGVRVEYIIGNEATRKLVPRLISETNFKELILAPLEEAIGGTHNYNRFKAFYDFNCLEDQKSDKSKLSLIARYPIVQKMNVYNLDTTASTVEINFLEELIKGYCPDYTFDQMDADHEETGYEAENELSPVFKLALEYSLNDDGFTVRQPTNGLRYNTTLYSIEKLDILPWMGAGNSYNEGYTFYPDGSGALFRFEELATKGTFTATRPIYGNDYSYQNIDRFGKYQKPLRMPVFGIQSNDTYYTFTLLANGKDAETGETKQIEIKERISITVLRGMKVPTVDNDITLTDDEKDIAKLERLLKELLAAAKVGDFIDRLDVVTSLSSEEMDALLVTLGIDPKADRTTALINPITSHTDIKLDSEYNGYFAIIEEGESLCELSTYHAGALSDYHTIKTSFNPRPKDSYDLSDSISVSGSKTQTVVSDRKYTGNLKIRYVMLSDETLAEETEYDQSNSYYKADYIGMAQAYSNYLAKKNILTRLTGDDVTADIPLYIESFGSVEVVETIMSFPVTVDKPLTTLTDVGTMYDELSEEGVKNINFRLTGFANGGMYSVMPTKIKWEKSVGGKRDMLELLEKAQGINKGEGNLTLYPEFELLYVLNTGAFDGVRFKRDIIRTIDNRYASQKEYSATYQTWISYYRLALSPAYMDNFYNKMLKAYDPYLEFGSMGISMSTMGTDLNSDFDEDEPYNREDNKGFIKEALAAISSKEGMAGVMTDGGNAYTYQYVDHLLNVALDSSRFMKSSNAIPFVGMVLHGYVQFAGSPLNMEGDINYAMLKAIENGASLYFMLSYRNTSYLKEFPDLSQYYSVNYNIWKEDVVKYYNELNSVMKDVQTSLIINHEFMSGTRVMDISEIEAAIREEMQKNDDYETAFDEITMMENIAEIAAARAAAKRAVRDMEKALAQLTQDELDIYDLFGKVRTNLNTCDTAYKAWQDSLNDFAASEYEQEQKKTEYGTKVYIAMTYARDAIGKARAATELYEEISALLETAQKAVTLLSSVENPNQDLIDDAEARVAEAEKLLGDIEAMAIKCAEYEQKIFDDVKSREQKYTEHFTKKDIDDLLDYGENDEDEEEIVEEEEDSIYINDNGNIVAVTYGGKNGNDNEAYKTFILNYNNFAVTVKYEVNGETRVYTIPANRYVVVIH